jgi:hypothetical protein
MCELFVYVEVGINIGLIQRTVLTPGSRSELAGPFVPFDRSKY